MNTANKLTMLRVALIPVFLILLYLRFPFHMYFALTVFILASVTDFVDGYIARHYNQVTDFGKFMDPLADKVLVMAALLWFVEALARLGASGGHRAGVRRHCPAAHRRGAGAGNRRRLVGQGQDGLHHGVHLPDAAHCPACAGSGVRGGDPGHHCPLGRGVFSEEQRCGGVE